MSETPPEEVPEDAEGAKGEMFLVAQSFQGPLPPPEVVEHYERIHPGAAEWIFDRARAEQEHRHLMERKMTSAEMALRMGGLAASSLLATVAVGGAIWLIAQGHGVTGLAALLTALATLVGLFIYRERREPRR